MSDEVNDSLGFMLHDVARLMRWSFDRKSQRLGLTRAQWSVLSSLRRYDGAQQKTLAQRLEVAPITLARHVDRLEEDGWVIRQDDDQDRRAKRVYLTDKGREILSELQVLGAQVYEEALQGVSAEEEKQLRTLLLRMRTNLSSQVGMCESLFEENTL